MTQILMEPIAWVHNQRAEVRDGEWGEVVSRVRLADDLPEAALKGLEDFSHVNVVYWFHKIDPKKAVSYERHPRNKTHWPKVGVLAQRCKNRPNRLGLTVARILRREGRDLWVAGLDAVNGTPVLDLKPVMSEFLPQESVTQPSWASELMESYWS